MALASANHSRGLFPSNLSISRDFSCWGVMDFQHNSIAMARGILILSRLLVAENLTLFLLHTGHFNRKLTSGKRGQDQLVPVGEKRRSSRLLMHEVIVR